MPTNPEEHSAVLGAQSVDGVDVSGWPGARIVNAVPFDPAVELDDEQLLLLRKVFGLVGRSLPEQQEIVDALLLRQRVPSEVLVPFLRRLRESLPAEAPPDLHTQLVRMIEAVGLRVLAGREAMQARSVRALLAHRLSPGFTEPPETGLWPESPVRRTVAVSVYTSTDDGVPVEQAVHEVLAAFGFDVTSELPPIYGSWFRLFGARAKKAVTAPEVTSRLAKMERALELQALGRPQAEIDAAQGDAVAKLLTALNGTPDAMIQIGSVLLIKVDGVPRVRNLSQLELSYLERNPSLFREPAAALQVLQRLDRAPALPGMSVGDAKLG